MAKHSVLFVCYGNICRSPMAEAIFHELAVKKGVRDQWIIDSAATSGHEAGSPIYSSAQRILKKHGINYEHTARKILAEDYAKFDYILGMDNENVRNLERMKPAGSKAEVRLLNYFHPKRKNQEIEDPWYADTNEAFQSVFNDCYESSQALLELVHKS